MPATQDANPARTPDTDTELLTVAEVAQRLKVSAKTVRRRIAAEEIPVVRLGDGDHAPIRIPKVALDGWLKGP
jgi:excisionase family DNA binding protein